MRRRLLRVGFLSFLLFYRAVTAPFPGLRERLKSKLTAIVLSRQADKTLVDTRYFADLQHKNELANTYSVNRFGLTSLNFRDQNSLNIVLVDSLGVASTSGLTDGSDITLEYSSFCAAMNSANIKALDALLEGSISNGRVDSIVVLDSRSELRLAKSDWSRLHFEVFTRRAIGAVTAHPSLKNVSLPEGTRESSEHHFPMVRHLLDNRVWGIHTAVLRDFLNQGVPKPSEETHFEGSLNLYLDSLGLPIVSVPIHGEIGTWITLRPHTSIQNLTSLGAAETSRIRQLHAADTIRVFPYPIGTVLVDDEENQVEKPLLFIQPIASGGLLATSNALMESVSSIYKPFRAECRGPVFVVWDSQNSNEPVIYVNLGEGVDSLSHKSAAYDYVLAVTSYAFEIELVHVEHMFRQSLGIKDVLKFFRIPYVFSVHDFYSVCASHNLLDENLKFCGGVCTEGSGACRVSLWPREDFGNLKNGSVFHWRKRLNEFLLGAAGVVFPSNSSHQIFAQSNPGLELHTIVINHHDLVESTGYKPSLNIEKDDFIRLLVLGDVGPGKGEYVYFGLRPFLEKYRIELHFFGYNRPQLQDVGVHYGVYSHPSEIDALVNKIRPHAALQLSVAPETFSHTLSEAWNNGLPVIAFDSPGAVRERIVDSGSGLLINPELRGEALLAEIKELFAQPQLLLRATDSIAEWRASEKSVGQEQYRQYADLYSSLISEN